MTVEEQAARKLSDECDKVIVAIANRNPAGLSGEFLAAFRAGYGYGVAALESQLSQAQAELARLNSALEPIRSEIRLHGHPKYFHGKIGIFLSESEAEAALKEGE